MKPRSAAWVSWGQPSRRARRCPGCPRGKGAALKRWAGLGCPLWRRGGGHPSGGSPSALAQQLEALKLAPGSAGCRRSAEDANRACEPFCRLARQIPTIFYEDLVCFRDIRPGAPHHFLVVPVEHMGNCKTLKAEHIPVVKRMMEVGNAVLQRNNFNDLNDVRMGFHWPPFCSISHLHLHVLAPASQLGFLSRLVYRINSYWFITVSVIRCVFAVL
uniref:Adenosine 5'-monophosphoramidase HINT3 n=1 Tax=Buteo japonicus TaxID=224669 RepID=A0A8B9Z6P5_9AVES